MLSFVNIIVAPDFKIEVPIQQLRLKPDIDYAINEMTPEQLEVFEALNYEGDDEAYEELEDDFVFIANDGEVPLKSKVMAREVADDIAEAIKKEKDSKKKQHTDDMFNPEKTSKGKPKTEKK